MSWATFPPFRAPAAAHTVPPVPARDPDLQHPDTTVNPDKRGQQANTNINTHNQGYQQDR